MNTTINNVLNNAVNIANNKTTISGTDLCPADARNQTSYSTTSCVCTKGTGNTQQIAAGGSYRYKGYINAGTPSATKIWYCSTTPN